VENFHELQTGCSKALGELEAKLNELTVVTSNVHRFDGDLRREIQRLGSELEASQSTCRKLEADLKIAQEKARDLTEALEKCRREKAAVSAEMESMQREWDGALQVRGGGGGGGGRGGGVEGCGETLCLQSKTHEGKPMRRDQSTGEETHPCTCAHMQQQTPFTSSVSLCIPVQELFLFNRGLLILC